MANKVAATFTTWLPPVILKFYYELTRQYGGFAVYLNLNEIISIVILQDGGQHGGFAVFLKFTSQLDNMTAFKLNIIDIFD
jgi:hypothetical protein